MSMWRFQSCGFGISAADQQKEVGMRRRSRMRGPERRERGLSERDFLRKELMTEPRLVLGGGE